MSERFQRKNLTQQKTALPAQGLRQDFGRRGHLKIRKRSGLHVLIKRNDVAFLQFPETARESLNIDHGVVCALKTDTEELVV